MHLRFSSCLGALGVSVVAFLIVGCNQNGTPRDVRLYREVLNGSHPTTKPSPYDERQPVSLQRALELANADNESIASSGEDYIQALASKMRDAGTFLPTLSLAPTYSLSKGGSGGFLISGLTGTSTGTSGSTGTGSTGGTTSSTGSSTGTIQITSSSKGINHTFSVPVGVSATGSLSNVSTYKAAGATASQRKQLLLDERETILLSVVTSYYTVLTDEQQVRVLERSLKSKQEKVRDQEARLRLGAVRPLDVAQSESDLATTRVSLSTSRTGSANARSALARLMAVSSVEGELTDHFDVPTDTPPLASWQVRAVHDRQDLAAAVDNVESARLKVEAAIREYFPSVSINFNYFLYNDPTSSQRWTNALSGSIPIFSALSIEADVRSAWSVARQAELAELQTRRVVTDDVNQNFENLRGSRERIEQLQVAVQAAQRAVDLAERAYTLGSESNLDRLTQQDNLLTAQLNLVNEQYSEKTSYLGLLRASGGLNGVLPGR